MVIHESAPDSAMSLGTTEPKFEEIPLGAGRVRLFPLSLDDVSTLLREHSSSLRQVMAMFDTVLEAEAYADKFSAYLLAASPGLISQAIAISAHEPEAVENVRKMPLGFQLRAFATITRMTLDGINPELVLRELADAVAPIAGMSASASAH